MINIDQLLVKFAEARYKVAAPPGVPAQGVPYYRGQPEAAHLFGPDGKLISDPRLTATSFMPLNAQNKYDSEAEKPDGNGGYVKNVAVHQGMGNQFNPTTQGFYAMPGGDPGTGMGGALLTGAATGSAAKLFQNRSLLESASYVPRKARTIANLQPTTALKLVERYTGGPIAGLSASRTAPNLGMIGDDASVASVGNSEGTSDGTSEGKGKGGLPSTPAARALALLTAATGKNIPMPGDRDAARLPGDSTKGTLIQRPPVAAKDPLTAFSRLLRPPPPSSVRLPSNQMNMGGGRGWFRAALPGRVPGLGIPLGGIPSPSTGAGRYGPLAAAALGMGVPLLANYSSDLTGAGIDPNEQGGVASLGMPHPQKVLGTATVPVPGPKKNFFGF